MADMRNRLRLCRRFIFFISNWEDVAAVFRYGRLMTTCMVKSLYSGEVISTLKLKGFRATSLSTLFTYLPHNLTEEKLLDLTEWSFEREGSPILACNKRNAFFYI